MATISTLYPLIKYPLTFGTKISESIEYALAKTVGALIRDHILFANLQKRFAPWIFQDCMDVFNKDVADPTFYPDKKEVLKLFQKKLETISFKHQGKSFSAKVLVLESNSKSNEVHNVVRIGGKDENLQLCPPRIYPFLREYSLCKPTKKLRFIQVSLYDITENSKLWKPLYFRDIGNVFFALQTELNKKFGQIDSLYVHSLGGTVLGALDHPEAKIVPPTLILDRSFTSMKKVGKKFLNPITFVFLYILAWGSGWVGNPEDSILKFFSRFPKNSLKNRSVIIIEVENDIYFSGKAAFDRNFGLTLRKLGLNVFSHLFEINLLKYHQNTPHSFISDNLSNRKKEIKQGVFTLKKNENIVFFLMNQVFMTKKNNKK